MIEKVSIGRDLAGLRTKCAVPFKRSHRDPKQVLGQLLVGNQFVSIRFDNLWFSFDSSFMGLVGHPDRFVFVFYVILLCIG